MTERSKVILVVLGLAGFGFLLLVILAVIRTGQASSDNVLQLTAARGPSGLTVTNRERVPLKNCDATLLDQGNDEWFAKLPDMRPSETVSVDWSAFRQNDQPLPSHIAMSRRNVIVSCRYDGTERRSAGVRF